MFRSNKAVDVEAMRQMNGTIAVRRWNLLRREAAAKGDVECTESEGCRYGQGGGIFIMFRNSTDKTAVTIKMESVDIANNSACLGGVDAHDKQEFADILV